MPTLWYRLRNSEERQRTQDEIINLRADPHILWVHASSVLMAIRNQEPVGTIEFAYREGFDRPSIFIYGSEQPIEDPEPPPTQTDLTDAMRIIQNFVQTRVTSDDLRRRHYPIGHHPLRQNIDYQATARRTFLVDSLPDPVSTNPAVQTWPDWCRVGATVYDSKDGYIPVQIVEKDDHYVKLEKQGEVYFIFYVEDLCENVSPVLPRGRWEALLDED